MQDAFDKLPQFGSQEFNDLCEHHFGCRKLIKQKE